MDLVDIYTLFPTKNDCLVLLEKVRWGEFPTCSYCGSNKCTSRNDHRYQCNSCYTTFSATVNTVFHHTKLELQKWFLALIILFGTRHKVSGRELARTVSINRNTALHVKARVISAMSDQSQRELMLQVIDNVQNKYGGYDG